MKTTERIKMLAMAFLIAIIGAGTFTACSSDDDDDNTKNKTSIIGTWRQDWGDDKTRDYTAYSFFEDKTGLFFDKGNGAERFSYEYNNNTITIIYNEDDYTEKLKVSDLSNKSISIDGESYYKTELTYDMLILGEWYIHVGIGNGAETKTRVCFYCNGTFDAKDYATDTDAMKETYQSFNSLSNIKKGTYSIKGKEININGSSQIAGIYIIDGLVANGFRFIRADKPNEYPYLIGGYHDR